MEEIENLLEGKRIVFLLGSRRPAPPVPSSNTISWLISSMEYHLTSLDIKVISMWDPMLEHLQYDKERYLHVSSSTLPGWLPSLLRKLPYRLKKALFGIADPDWIEYFVGQARLLRQLRPDIVVTHVHWPAFKMAVLAYPEAMHIFYFHSSDFGSWPQEWGAHLCRYAKGLVTICRAALDSFEALYGPPPFPARVIYNGVNLEMFNRELRMQKRAVSRLKYHLKEDDIVVLYAGRITYTKGLDLILSAWQEVQKAIPNLKLVIAGDEKFERVPDLAFCRQFREALVRLGSQNIRLVGWIPYEQMMELYAAADISILASREVEGNSMFLLESMACGIPVISTRVGGVPEVVSDGKTGILVPIGDAHSGLVEALRRLALDPNLREKMGMEAAAHVRANFSTKRMAQELASFIGEVVEREIHHRL
jgi:glycosyltransferase involved in cell wall biosynthesis